MSKTRKRYMFRLIIRCIVLVGGVLLCIFAPSQFEVIEGTKFFARPSVLHILWLAWVADMIQQIVPLKKSSSGLTKAVCRPL